MVAQEHEIIDGKPYELKTLAKGDLILLWNHTDRFFVKDNNGKIHELINTSRSDNRFNQEYKHVLNTLVQDSDMSANRVGFGRYGLKQFIKAYNSKGPKRYTYTNTNERAKIQSRMGLSGGLTNHPFIKNTENTLNPFFGVEFEVFEQNKIPRLTGYFGFRHALESENLKYKLSELSLGCRYRFINKSKFNIYGSIEFATYSFMKRTVSDGTGNPESFKESAFHVPLAFGVGSDLKINNHSFITLTYNALFAFLLDNQGNFPVDFALGYKFNL